MCRTVLSPMAESLPLKPVLKRTEASSSYGFFGQNRPTYPILPTAREDSTDTTGMRVQSLFPGGFNLLMEGHWAGLLSSVLHSGPLAHSGSPH